MPPTPFPTKHFSPNISHEDWGGWEETNQKESEMKRMTPDEFVDKWLETKKDPIYWQDYKALLEMMEAYAAEVAKDVRHKAAEIAISIGGERDVQEAHRDIMNIKI